MTLPTLRLGLSLFVLTWLIYGLAANSSNLKAFNLQQMGIEAIVERGHFNVEGSRTPEFKTPKDHLKEADLFKYNGHLYAAKQPGQFMAGALAYFPLHALGLSYLNEFLLTSALVTWLTAGLATALAVLALFGLAAGMTPGRSRAWAVGAALAFGVATMAFGYSGIAHHDALASAYLLIAFYFVFRIGRGSTRANLLAAAAGLFLGLTITTSMLPFFMSIIVGIYFLSLRRWSLLAWMLAGLALGLAPLLFYDAVNFGNPFVLPNIAGNFSDTFFNPTWKNFTAKVGFYSNMVTLYAPILWLGLAGLLILPHAFRREQLAVLAMTAVLVAYVLNIDTTGDCQFGPRYLLPALPFLSLGLVGFATLPGRMRIPSLIVLLAVGLFSFAVNLTGALYGAMYCDLKKYAFTTYLAQLTRGQFLTYPLAIYLVLPSALAFVWFLVALRRRARTASPHLEAAPSQA